MTHVSAYTEVTVNGLTKIIFIPFKVSHPDSRKSTSLLSRAQNTRLLNKAFGIPPTRWTAALIENKMDSLETLKLKSNKWTPLNVTFAIGTD